MAIAQLTWAPVPLADPASYYGGYKEPRLLAAGPFIRALSDRNGEYQAASFDVEISDHDLLMRTKLADATARYIINKTVIARTISDEGRRAQEVPRTVGIGVIRDYEPLADRRFRFRCEDYLAVFTGLGRDVNQIPKRTLNKTDFPDLPSNLVGAPVPIIYGDLTSEASATPPPTISLSWADGGFWNPDVEGTGRGVWHAGWSTVSPASAAAIPTGITVAEAGGGSIGLGWNEENLFNVAVTAVDASDIETDPEAFNWHEPNYAHAVTLTGDNKQIDVSWSAAAGAVAYRVYIGHANADEAICMIQTAGTSCSFDQLPKKGELPTADNIATGSNLIEFDERWLYAVSALMADGETVLSPLIYGKSQGYRRPLKIDWVAIPSVVEYYVYRRKVQVKGINGATEDSIWDRRWTVAAGTETFTDDLLDTDVTMVNGAGTMNGAVPLTFVGMETAADGSRWHRFLVCGHAVKEITGVFVDGELVDAGAYGVQACVPGQTGYSTFFPDTGSPQYRDLNDRRYTIVYGRGPVAAAVAAGEKQAAVNVKGVEATGDGTGDLVTDLFDQYLHFCQNFLFGDYQGGAWDTVGPNYPDVSPDLPVIDAASFATCKAIGAARVVGGYVGGTIIGGEGERHTVRDILRRWNTSADCFSGFNARSQFMVAMIDTAADPSTGRHYTETLDITEGAFDWKDQVQDMENQVPFAWNRSFSRQQWIVPEDEVEDSTSITNYAETKRGQLLELWCIRDATMAEEIAQRRLDRLKIPPRVVTFKIPLQGMSTDLGHIIRVTHSEGAGASGWTERPLFVIRHVFDADQLSVELTGLDIADLLP